MEMMVKAGVDGIITDDPQTLINLLEKDQL